VACRPVFRLLGRIPDAPVKVTDSSAVWTATGLVVGVKLSLPADSPPCRAGERGLGNGMEVIARNALPRRRQRPGPRPLATAAGPAGRLAECVPGSVGAEDAHAAGGVLDDGQDVQAHAGHRHRFDEVSGEHGVGLGAQERGPGGCSAVGGGVDGGVA
jgi:hypothetical protein